ATRRREPQARAAPRAPRDRNVSRSPRPRSAGPPSRPPQSPATRTPAGRRGDPGFELLDPLHQADRLLRVPVGHLPIIPLADLAGVVVVLHVLDRLVGDRLQG